LTALYRILGWLLLTQGLLLTLVFLQPYWKPYTQGLPIEVRFPTVAEIFGAENQAPDSTNLQNIRRQFALGDTLTDQDTLPETTVGGGLGSLIEIGDTIPTDTLAVNVIQNPRNDNGKTALDAFFRSLAYLQAHPEADTVVRLAHYGDSQIEGDRITEYLRKYFQKQFGGSGLGYIPFVEQATHHAFTRTLKGNWKKYSVFQNKYKNRYYGASGCVFRFGNGKDNQPKRAAVGIHFPYYRQAYDYLRLMYGKNESPFDLEVRNLRDSVVYAHRFPKSDTLHYVNLPVEPMPKGFQIRLEGESSPDLYGLFLESKNGVQIDNFALRGHSGIGLTSIDQDFLKAQFNLLGTKLIIFHYGGNIVPYDSPNFLWYEQEVYRMLRHYQRAVPDASLLVIGVADAGYKKGEKLHAFASVPKIRDAQKRAAERAGVAFWDFYEVMGGNGAILTWAKARPALVGHDLAHFTPYGQKLVANLLFSALMKEYNRFLKENIKPQAAH
jgi:lysophospholipase L1-like esterase